MQSLVKHTYGPAASLRLSSNRPKEGAEPVTKATLKDPVVAEQFKVLVMQAEKARNMQ